jgi:cobalt-zinc-cadmium resistance protein CzcA
VANNYVDVIAQWPGISAEQIEQQVTIPLETVMNGIPGIAHVRSWSIFGLSTVEMVFGEDTTNFENRERVLERLSQVTHAARSRSADGNGLEPGRPDLLLHACRVQTPSTTR